MKGAIVIGSSTGIGRALARCLAANGYRLGLAGRNREAMAELSGALATGAVVKQLDVTRTEEARTRLRQLIDELGGAELIVVNAGIGSHAPDWEGERAIIEVNARGFAAMARTAMSYFEERGSGHLVGVTSIAGLRGLRAAYSGSKAFASTYLEALRLEADARGLDVTVTDVKPGFVATPMTEGRSDMFWVASAEEAAAQICEAIRKKKRHVYVTRRWRLMGWLLKALPYPVVSFLRSRR